MVERARPPWVQACQAVLVERPPLSLVQTFDLSLPPAGVSTSHGCKCFQAHLCLLSFYLIAFSFKRLVRGHCLGVVTSGDNVTHKHFTEMRRLARDEIPFLLAMPPRATTMAW
jgi:hypothetical protein